MALLMPETAWPLMAYQYLREGPSPVPWPTAFNGRLDSLRTCVTGSGVVEMNREAPELGLLSLNEAFASREWGEAFAARVPWPWAQALVAKETPQAEPAAKEAQVNRLGLLGRLLHLCRYLKRDPGERINAEMYALLAKMPSRAGREAVLKQHIKWLCKPETSDWAQQVERTLTQCKTAEARTLALLTHCIEPGLAATHTTMALFNSSAVVKDGDAYKRLVAMLVDPTQLPENVRVARPLRQPNLLCTQILRWPEPRQLLALMVSAAQEACPLALAKTWAHDPAQSAEALRAACSHSESLSRAGAALLEAVERPKRCPDMAEIEKTMGRLALALIDPEDTPAERRTLRKQLGTLWEELRSQAYLIAERQRLRACCLFVREQPVFAEIGAALLQSLPEKEADTPARPNAASADALQKLAKGLPRGPFTDWARDLVKQTLRTTPAPAKAGKAVALEAVLAQAPVRQFFNQHVVPMMLSLQRFSALIYEGNIDPLVLRNPDDVRAQVFRACQGQPWPSLWEPLQSRVHKPENLVVFGAGHTHWPAAYRVTASAAYRKLLQAVVHDEHLALRRKTPQMQQILALPTGTAVAALWEAGFSQDIRFDGAAPRRDYVTITDTADIGAMLAATTELRSCQAADCYEQNLGMLNRMLCGSKRMLIVRGAEGKILARAALRLMTGGQGTPVLTLSMVYGDAQNTLRERIHAYVRKRARTMGLAAASTSMYQGSKMVALTSLGHTIPDYWDETKGLSDATTCVSALPLVDCKEG